jgi:hypothetical protein
MYIFDGVRVVEFFCKRGIIFHLWCDSKISEAAILLLVDKKRRFCKAAYLSRSVFARAAFTSVYAENLLSIARNIL